MRSFWPWLAIWVRKPQKAGMLQEPSLILRRQIASSRGNRVHQGSIVVRVERGRLLAERGSYPRQVVLVHAALAAFEHRVHGHRDPGKLCHLLLGQALR